MAPTTFTECNEATVQDAAVFYATRGLALVKILPKEKKPFEIEWQKRDYSTPEKAAIAFREHNGNIGIRGDESGLMGVDFDDANFKEALLRELPMLNDTLQSVGRKETGHFWIRLSTPLKNESVRLHFADKKKQTFADLRGIGGQIVVAPSIHPEGNQYRWRNNNPVLTIDTDVFLTALDVACRAVGCKNPYHKTPGEEAPQEGTGIFAAVKAAVSVQDYLATKSERVNCPVHTETTPSRAMRLYPATNSCYCFSCGFTGDVIALHARIKGIAQLAAAQELAKKYNIPFVDVVVPKTTVSGFFVGFNFETIAATDDSLGCMENELKKEIAYAYDDFNTKEYDPKTGKQIEKENPRAIQKRLELEFYHRIVPDIFICLYPTVHIIDTNETISFSGQTWTDTEPLLFGWLEKRTSINEATKFKQVMKDEILSHVRDKTQIMISEWKDAPPYMIPFKNGLLDIRTLELRKYTAEDRIRLTLMVDWNPEAICPKTEKFLDEICTTMSPDGLTVINGLDGKPAVNQIMRKSLIQLVGYFFWRGYPIQKIFLLLGVGGNGKGVFSDLLRKMLGAQGYSAKSFSELTDDRFATADLYGKFANINSELTTRQLSKTDVLKALCGGDQISAQRKHQDPFTFENRAKLINSSNKLPETQDTSRGFFRRLHPIHFSRIFEGSEDNKTLRQELECELAGFARMGVLSLKEWIDADGSFKKDAEFAGALSAKENEALYIMEVDTIAAFIEECCSPPEGGQQGLDGTVKTEEMWIAKAAMLAAYQDFCAMRGILMASERQFHIDFPKKFVPGVRKSQKGPVGNRIWGYLGVVLTAPQKKEEPVHHVQENPCTGSTCARNDPVQVFSELFSDVNPFHAQDAQLLPPILSHKKENEKLFLGNSMVQNTCASCVSAVFTSEKRAQEAQNEPVHEPQNKVKLRYKIAGDRESSEFTLSCFQEDIEARKREILSRNPQAVFLRQEAV